MMEMLKKQPKMVQKIKDFIKYNNITGVNHDNHDLAEIIALNKSELDQYAKEINGPKSWIESWNYTWHPFFMGDGKMVKLILDKQNESS